MTRYRISIPDGTPIGESEGLDAEEAVLAFLNGSPGWSGAEPWADELILKAEEIGELDGPAPVAPAGTRRVDCDEDCGALEEPGDDLVELHLTLEHYRSHGCGGCSHGG